MAVAGRFAPGSGGGRAGGADPRGPGERAVRRAEPVARDGARYAACGSVQQVATRLYCHRNTVVNRLRRFAELTGCDVTVPDQAVLAQAVLSWDDCGVVALRDPG
ncbi:MAG: hypothetical protein GEV12_23075 [Micromonosporaceae bacterium]|nr:hypothetical protein [Micromonosporaceae bacterium]